MNCSHTGAYVSPFAAAVFASMLQKPLKWRLSPASGIHPDNAAALRVAFGNLNRAGAEWKRSQRLISVVPWSSTEMAGNSNADVEIDTDEAARLLNRTTSRVRQLLRSGELPGRHVGRGWLVKRSEVIAYSDAQKKAAA